MKSQWQSKVCARFRKPLYGGFTNLHKKQVEKLPRNRANVCMPSLTSSHLPGANAAWSFVLQLQCLFLIPVSYSINWNGICFLTCKMNMFLVPHEAIWELHFFCILEIILKGPSHKVGIHKLFLLLTGKRQIPLSVLLHVLLTFSSKKLS